MKTVSWYLHSLLQNCIDICVITSDRVPHYCTFGRAIRDYGPELVYTSVVTPNSVTLLLY